VLGIKEKESGLSDVMYPTPTQDSASERTKKYKQGGTPLPLAVKMYPTPTVGCEEGGEQSERVEQTKSGGFILRKKNNPQMTFGAKLSDAMIYLEKKMFPTPTARDHKDLGYNPITCKREIKQQSIPTTVLKNNKPGGKLNPNFVEFLMGYPMNWTKIEPTESKVLETQSYHKSQENLEKQSLKQKMYRTPTSMDTNEDSMIYAAKILKGKVNRNSNSRVQITLSTDVAMEYLKNNPHLIDQFDKPFMYRPNLPDKLEFIDYLKSQTTIKELVSNTDIAKTKIEHWFRKDNCFSYPTINDWNKIKPLLKDIKFDKELTYEVEKDWKEIE
jgi:DNA (cytosine-5)-methyltransferase 1